MTIQRNETWERPLTTTCKRVEARSLGEAHSVINDRGAALDSFVLDLTQAPDVCESLGISIAESDSTPFEYSLDLLTLQIGDHRSFALAHIAATSTLYGSATFVMNGQRFGTWNLGRKAHPNDGKLDVVSWRGVTYPRWRQIRKRLPTGSFSPHPQIIETRAPHYVEHFENQRRLNVDGINFGKCDSVEVTVLDDALLVVA